MPRRVGNTPFWRRQPTPRRPRPNAAFSLLTTFLASCFVDAPDLANYQFICDETNCETLPQSQLSVTSASTDLAGAAAMFDGRLETRWLSQPASLPAEFVISLDRERPIVSLDLNTPNYSYITAADISIGSAGAWQPAASIRGAKRRAQIVFPAIEGSQIRVVVWESEALAGYFFVAEVNVAVPR